ncbi:MAG: HigA family addiction module antitoxin [Gammaproteobacteria bacterium]
MTIERKITKRKPDSVGTILREEFLKPYGLTQEQLAVAMGVTRTLINELVNDRRGITIDTAIMLGKVFKCSPQFWLNIYLDSQLWNAFHNPKKVAKFKKVMSVDDLPHKAA